MQMEQQVERFVTVPELMCVALIATGVTQRVIVFIRLCVPRKYRNFMSLPFFPSKGYNILSSLRLCTGVVTPGIVECSHCIQRYVSKRQTEQKVHIEMVFFCRSISFECVWNFHGPMPIKGNYKSRSKL